MTHEHHMAIEAETPIQAQIMALTEATGREPEKLDVRVNVERGVS